MAVSAFIRSHFRHLIGVSNNAVALFPNSAWYSVCLQFLCNEAIVLLQFFSFRLCINYSIAMLNILRLQNRIKSQSYTTSISEIKDTIKTKTKKSEKKISKVMMTYLQRAKEHGSY